MLRQRVIFFVLVSFLFSGASSGALSLERDTEHSSLKDMMEGDRTAPVTIIEYASLVCSHCADFYLKTLPELREKYIKTGKVRLIFREFIYEPRAAAGFMLARCLPKERYFSLIEVLFQKQADWAFVLDAKQPLMNLAKLAGFSEKTFEACLQDQNLLDSLNRVVQRGRDDFGVQATPTFFINGRKYEGALSFEKISEIIDSLL